MSELIKEIQKFVCGGNNSYFSVVVEMVGDTADENYYPDGFGPRLHISLGAWTGEKNPEMKLYVEGMSPEEMKDLGTRLIMAGEQLKEDWEVYNEREKNG